ncbi:MARVEL domain-containing protein sing [Rhynchophorus ferrugineus]|uniref:MARVEL domain-containing protein sing n=1 Tax=Rhynchophorus ferrugineus TaxID=354439 RepID=UPI003FCC912F
MHQKRGPTVVNVPVHSSRTQNGFSCCCCQCCTCIHLEYFKTRSGMIKLAELILGFLCQGIGLQYGSGLSDDLGLSFKSFFTNVVWCLSTTLFLVICYVFSPKSIGLVKSSIFEVLFNSLAAFTFLGTCSYLAYVVNEVLNPVNFFMSQFRGYPAMSTAYILGSILGLVYAYDAYKSYRYFKGYRY